MTRCWQISQAPVHCREIFNGKRKKLTILLECPIITILLSPQEYSITTTGNQFLQIDSHHNGRMLMFGLQESIDFLRNTPDWFLDKTFYTVPPQFLQLYTFHGFNRGRNDVDVWTHDESFEFLVLFCYYPANLKYVMPHQFSHLFIIIHYIYI